MTNRSGHNSRPVESTCANGHHRRRAARRHGAVTLEIILVTPIYAILAFAVVEFALYLWNYQQVAIASRVGGVFASQTSPLPNEGDVAGDPVPSAITDAILQQLASSGIDPCAIILEHNVNMSSGFMEQTLRTDYVPDCPACSEPATAIPPNSVRISVCVALEELMPNCLQAFGFDITGCTTYSSTTFCYEL